MTEYHSIVNLFERDKKTKKLIIGKLSKDCFSNINRWEVTEKIDGMNIRIIIDNQSIKFRGRTDDAQIRPELIEYLESHFTRDKIIEIFGEIKDTIVIYGEGYGPKIQACGANYRNDLAFILFDIKIGKWWLEYDSLKRISNKLEIPIVPLLDIGSCFFDSHISAIIYFLQNKPLSLCSIKEQVMEGVICKTPYFDRDGSRIMFKLKVNDLINIPEYTLGVSII